MISTGLRDVQPTKAIHPDPLNALVMPRSLRVVMLAMLATSVFAQHPKIADLETLDLNSMAKVIVQYSHVPGEQLH
jgi:hypothetical protein